MPIFYFFIYKNSTEFQKLFLENKYSIAQSSLLLLKISLRATDTMIPLVILSSKRFKCNTFIFNRNKITTCF